MGEPGKPSLLHPSLGGHCSLDSSRLEHGENLSKSLIKILFPNGAQDLCIPKAYQQLVYHYILPQHLIPSIFASLMASFSSRPKRNKIAKLLLELIPSDISFNKEQDLKHAPWQALIQTHPEICTEFGKVALNLAKISPDDISPLVTKRHQRLMLKGALVDLDNRIVQETGQRITSEILQALFKYYGDAKGEKISVDALMDQILQIALDLEIDPPRHIPETTDEELKQEFCRISKNSWNTTWKFITERTQQCFKSSPQQHKKHSHPTLKLTCR